MDMSFLAPISWWANVDTPSAVPHNNVARIMDGGVWILKGGGGGAGRGLIVLTPCRRDGEGWEFQFSWRFSLKGIFHVGAEKPDHPVQGSDLQFVHSSASRSSYLLRGSAKSRTGFVDGKYAWAVQFFKNNEMNGTFTQKNDFVTETNICDTDNRALFEYRLQPYLCIYYFFNRHYKVFSKCNQIKIVVWKLSFWQWHFLRVSWMIYNKRTFCNMSSTTLNLLP